jgi:hypothetical protein
LGVIAVTSKRFKGNKYSTRNLSTNKLVVSGTSAEFEECDVE